MISSESVTNKFYETGERRAERVKDLFATIAPRYDFINDLQSGGLHRIWKRRLLTLAAGRPGERVLDLCCGTGDVALAFAQQGLRVVGLDFSEPMLAVARERVKSPKFTDGGAVEFLQGDALRAPFPDASFDIVTISYGLRNLADWEAGLREMRRLARPGGRLLVLDFGKPDNALWRGIYFSYLRWCVPVLGKIFCGDSDTHGYILESLTHYAAQRGVEAKMKELSLAHTRLVNLLGGVMSINYAEKPR
ncbi:MAG TPA: ubiquinone/menaquinone biosynthesis methyltransferase [Verrucomicrobiae bacterium]|nr:ubiquinone/menaquinone biosynthesis methyltransferase [Verrucomicrobiae bacterium]